METKDIDINAGVEEKTNNVIKEVKDNEIKDSEIKENKNIEKEEQKNLIQKESTKEEKILKDEILNENNNFQKNINEQKDDIDNLINSLE